MNERDTRVIDKWDKRFLMMAQLIGTWSKDPSTKVGAVIVDTNQRIVATGYNGFPRGVIDDEESLGDRNVKYPLTIHAEANAILFANVNLTGFTIYSTHPTCAGCAAMVAQTGISRVVWIHPEPQFIDRWKESTQLAKRVFHDAGISTTIVDGDF